MASSSNKRLYKSIEYRVFTGVASGIADYFNASHTSIRFLFILLSLASGLGLIFYVTLSVLLPTEDEVNEQEDLEFYYNITHAIPQPEVLDQSKVNIIDKIVSAQNILSLFVVFIGSFTLQFDIVPWKLIPDYLWVPGVLVTIGMGFIIKSLTSKKEII